MSKKNSLEVHNNVAPPPPCAPKRVPMGTDAPSPEPMVYSFICICQSPQKGALPRNAGKKYSHLPRSPTRTEGLHRLWGDLAHQGDSRGESGRNLALATRPI